MKHASTTLSGLMLSLALTPAAHGAQLMRMADIDKPAISPTTPSPTQLVPMQARTKVILTRMEPLPTHTSATAALVPMQDRPKVMLTRMERLASRTTATAMLVPMQARPAPQPRGTLLAGASPSRKLVRLADLPPRTPEEAALAIAQAGRAATGGAAGQGSGTDISDPSLVGQPGIQGTGEAISPTNAQLAAQAADAVIMAPGTEEVLLEMRLDKNQMPNLLSARQTAEGQIYLPLAEVLKNLDFPITVANGTAKGWFISPQRTFSLDPALGYAEIAGKRIPLPKGSILREGNNLFVNTAALAAWFPLQARVAWNELALDLTSTEELPSVARLNRQKLWADRSARTGPLPEGPVHQLTAAWAAWPNIQLDAGMNYYSNNEKSGLNNSLGVQAEGSLLAHDANLALSFSQGPSAKNTFNGGSFRLSRTGISNTLLGPLRARSYELGDVMLPRPSQVGTPSRGRGFSVTNKAPGFAGGLNQFELKGDGPRGWDVEVYQQETLAAFGTVGNDGRYVFNDLNLRSGVNDFRIVLYGPQGEQQERRESFYLGQGMVKPGALVYEAGVMESNKSVIPDNRTTANTGSAVAINTFYGLTENLSLNVGGGQGNMGNGNGDMAAATFGLRGAFGRSFTQGNVTTYSDGSTAFTLQENLRVGKNANLGASYARLASPTAGAVRAGTLMGLTYNDSYAIGPGKGTPFNYGFALTRQGYARDDTAEYRATATQGAKFGRLNLSHGITREWEKESGRGQWTNGNLAASTNVAGLPWRAEVQYDPDDKNMLANTRLSTQVRVGESTVALQGQYQPPEDLYSLQSSIRRDFGPVNMALQSTAQSNNTYQVGLNLGVQLVPEPSAGPVYHFAPGRSEGLGYGSADILVFIDDNGNNVFDTGEETVQGAQVRNARTGKPSTTNERGLARLSNLFPNAQNVVQVDETSLPDIYLKPATPAQIVLATRGYGGRVELPLLRQGEVIGMLEGDTTDVALTLINAKGEQVDITSAASDGTFYFSYVPLGSYTLTAKSSDGNRHASKTFTITKDAPSADVTLRLP